MLSIITQAIGSLVAWGIRAWVRLTGKKLAKRDAPWLDCPMGPPGRIGSEFYEYLARRENLTLKQTPDFGLLPCFEALSGSEFDSGRVRTEIRDFYEHTALYRLEAWSEASLFTRLFLWALTRFVSRRMDQLNFPVSSLELARGMTSDILPMFDSADRRVYTGWLRRISTNDRVIYTGLYSVQRPAEYTNPCVKVSFPVPFGSSTVFLRPEAQSDGSFKLISSGDRFGEPGFYRMVEVDAEHWRVRYIRTLREYFHVYIDDLGTLRTDHTVRFLGLTTLRLHYKLECLGPGNETIHPALQSRASDA
ncbi:MAG: hypothetical protein L0229_01070 [Blastocatellia bacterium]|nr:hypothetical protein [Blastocatellia bacterium]